MHLVLYKGEILTFQLDHTINITERLLKTATTRERCVSHSSIAGEILFPPLDGASSASGYTPTAVPGGSPDPL